MKNVLLFLVTMTFFGCNQQDQATSIQQGSPQVRMDRGNELMHMAGLPASQVEKEAWATRNTYATTDPIIQDFLRKRQGTLSADDVEIFNRTASRFMLNEMNLIGSNDQPKLKRYVTVFFKTGGRDVALLWKGLQLSRANRYWPADVEAQATWYLDALIDATIKHYGQNIVANKKLISDQPIYKALLEGDNTNMLQLMEQYKPIKKALASLPKKPVSLKEEFMKASDVD